jgi:hypothetical protein
VQFGEELHQNGGSAKIAARVAGGRIKDPDKIGVAAGKIINKRKVAKHFDLDITQGQLTWRRNQASIDAEALTDGIYVIRTPVPAETLDAPGAVAACKALASLERDFRSIKADDLDLRPSSTVSKTASAPTC